MALILCWFVWEPAHASPYELGVMQSFTQQSNVYQIGDDQALPAGLSRSDTIRATSLVVGIDQTWGRQRLSGSGHVRADRYGSNKRLDNQSHGLNLTLDWATIGRLSGTVSVATDNSLAQFNNRAEQGIETEKNAVRNVSVDAKVRLGVVTRYALEGTFGQRRHSYSATAYDRYANHQDHVSLGLRYRPGGPLEIGILLRATDIHYPRWRHLDGDTVEGERVKRQDLELTADWRPSSANHMTLRLSPTRSHHERATVADFSGVVGAVSWIVQPTGKTRLNTTVWRDLGQSADAVALFPNGVYDFSRTTTALSTKLQLELTGKTVLTAGLSLAHRTLGQNLLLENTVFSALSGRDQTTSLSVGAQWNATRAIQTGCELTGDRRHSSEPRLSVSMRNNAVSCYGQLSLK